MGLTRVLHLMQPPFYSPLPPRILTHSTVFSKSEPNFQSGMLVYLITFSGVFNSIIHFFNICAVFTLALSK